jgi:hypothetical protein
MIHALRVDAAGPNTLIVNSLNEFNTWKELETFLILTIKGSPEEISIKIMDCFSRVSIDSKWINPNYHGFDIISLVGACFVIWNDEMTTPTDFYNKIPNLSIREIFIREVRDMKINSIK